MFNSLTLFQAPSIVSTNKNKTYKTSVNPLHVAVGVILIGLNAIIFFSYLSGVNSYTSAGYQIHKLQTSLNQLNGENQKLTLKVSEQSSMVAVRGDLDAAQFVSVTDARFLQINHLSER